MSKETILVADVGGTNTRFALAERNDSNPGQRPSVFEFWKTPGDDHSDLYAAVDAYLKRTGAKPDRAIFAVAGPVIDNSVEFTNRNWFLSATELKAKFSIETVDLINDFVAMARSAPFLSSDEYQHIRSGAPVPGEPIVVGGPGTGYGLATLVSLRRDYLVVGGQGGHQAFSPQNKFEIELLERLQLLHGYVSNENVAAGIAFENTLQATFEIYGRTPEPWTPSQVLEKAEQGDEMCREYCQMRANVTMTALGDAVLASVARGGAWLAGGVSIRLKHFLKNEQALKRFASRGQMTELMKDIPVNMITSDAAALIGAAGYRCLS